MLAIKLWNAKHLVTRYCSLFRAKSYGSGYGQGKGQVYNCDCPGSSARGHG